MATDLNYLKRAILTLALSADERDAPDLGAQFYSYDKQSGKFIIRLIDEEDQPINLSQFAVINIVMAPNRDISKGRTIVPMQSEDPEDGVVSVILPDNIRQFNGTIIAGVVAMNADNIKTHDFGYFRFEMRQSLIDANIENLSDFYVDEFEQLREQIHQIMQDTLDDIDAFKLDITNQLNTLVTRINTIRKDIDQLFADLKNFKLFKAYKMADGTFTKRLPPVNLFSSKYLSTTVADTSITKTGFRKNTPNTVSGWGTAILGNFGTMLLLKPNTKYTINYEYKILTMNTQGVKYINDQMGTLLLFSGVAGYQNISLSTYPQGSSVNEIAGKKVGDVLKRSATFTTPANLADPQADYRILFYTLRGVNDQNAFVLAEAGEFQNIKISTGDDVVFYTTNPQDDPLNAYPKWQGLGMQDSNEPDSYQWELSDDYATRFKVAYQMADGTFTKDYPNENLWIQSLTLKGYIRADTGEIIPTNANPQHETMNARTAVPPNKVLVWQCWNPDKITNISNATRVGWYRSDNTFISSSAIPYLKGETYLTQTFTPPTGATQCRLSTIVGTADNIKNQNIRHKFELVDVGESGTVYTTNPNDDIINAYPKKRGLAGDVYGNKVDYQWELTEEYVTNRLDRFALASGKLAVLDKTVDLNNVIETGNYIVAGSPNSPANEPNSAILQVFNGGSDKMVVQFFTGMGSNKTYYRTCHVNFDWFQWKSLNTTMDNGFVELKKTQDFNTLKTTQVCTNANVTTALHAPVDGSFIVEVSQHNDSYTVQRATLLTAPSQVYHRQLVNNTWSPWYKYDLLPATGLTNYLPNGYDLNTLRNYGFYTVQGAVNAPFTGSDIIWYIKVLVRLDTDVSQEITVRSTTDRTFTRQLVSNVWTPWTEVLSASSGVALTGNQTIAGLKNFTTRPTVGGVQVMLTINSVVTGTANWDSYKDTGTYYFSGITNSPKYMSNYGYLEVMAAPNTNGVIQKYTDLDGNCIMRVQKTLSAGVIGWAPWKIITLELPDVDLVYNTGWKNYYTINAVDWAFAKAARSGNTVQLRGAISNTVDFTPSNDQVLMATIPEGYRPKMSVYGQINRSSGRTIYTCEVTNTGRITNSTMVDPGINGYASTQPAGKVFHIGMDYIGEDIAFF